jgi:deoxyribonuclease V
MELRVTYEELENRGFDAGGGEILYYKGKPFTGAIVEYKNGLLISEEEFIDGHLGGAQRNYYSNGRIEKEYFVAFNTHYGFIRRWDENGNLAHERYSGPKVDFYTYRDGVPYNKALLAIDVYYPEGKAKAVGALFYWQDEVAKEIISIELDNIEAYIPGEFYKRELPCILKVIEKVDFKRISTIIVDGNVYIDNEGTFGLGGKLWEALDGKIPVIGVAKTFFKNTEEKVIPVERGQSKNPLFVSAIGMDTEEAGALIKGMKGEHRMPDILKYVDTLTKEA